VKAGESSTGNGDKQEGPDLTGNNRPASMDERGKGWHFNRRINNDHPYGQKENDPEFHVSAEIITRDKQQPDR